MFLNFVKWHLKTFNLFLQGVFILYFVIVVGLYLGFFKVNFFNVHFIIISRDLLHLLLVLFINIDLMP